MNERTREDQWWRLLVHESSHACIDLAEGFELQAVQIDGQRLAGECHVVYQRWPHEPEPSFALRQITAILAGQEGEQLIARSTRLHRGGDGTDSGMALRVAREVSGHDEAAARRLVEAGRKRAALLVQQHRHAIVAVARQLARSASGHCGSVELDGAVVQALTQRTTHTQHTTLPQPRPAAPPLFAIVPKNASTWLKQTVAADLQQRDRLPVSSFDLE